VTDWLLGIDGGGTGCRAALVDGTGAVRGRGSGGAANIMTDLRGALENILAASAAALAQAGLDAGGFGRVDAVLGLAGTNVGGYRQQLIGLLPFRRSLVESDALIALEGALGEADGAIAIIGTGSIFTARRAGRLRTIGGWGLTLGDWGGGARIGKRLLEETLLAHDDIREGSGLSDHVMSRFAGDPRALVQFAAEARPKDYGEFAPLVFQYAGAGDALAARILAEAVGHLEEALRALRLEPGERLCLLGGLSTLAAPYFAPDLQSFIHAPLGDALAGALALGARHFSQEAAR
jgi:glucosamine kinase